MRHTPGIQKYPLAFHKSQSFLKAAIEQVDLTIPFDVERIIHECDIILLSSKQYDTFRQETQSKRQKVNIKDGRVYFDPKRSLYMIVYNEDLPCFRIRFTLAHELAHILLRHLDSAITELNRGGMNDSTYYRFEGEANTFAGNLLMPPILYHECAQTHLPLLNTTASRFFQISEWFKPSANEIVILNAFKSKIHTRICAKCGHSTLSNSFTFCPICGTEKLEYFKEDTAMQEYESLPTDATGKLVECCTCENGEHLEGVEYCMICATRVSNKCTSAIDDYPNQYNQCPHSEPLPSNARFCPYCGQPTTFLKDNILSPWDAPLF